jgi:quinolinate synthase
MRENMSVALPIIDESTLTAAEIGELQAEIRALAAERGAVILAHNYQRPEVQDVADYVGDSLGLSRQAAATDTAVIVFCGVHFMAETASILSPDKRVLLPDLRAGCSLADTITAEDVRHWKAQYPEYVAVGYVNTTAEVKAELEYCCTSGNVLDVIDAIPAHKGILFLPDFFLGAHIKRARPDRNVEIWMGECHVHKNINARVLNARRKQHPDAEVLVHPECGCAGQLIYGLGLGDTNGNGVHITSTEGMVREAKRGTASSYIVATEVGILHRMQQMAPEKTFLPADPEALCAFMKAITLESVVDALREDQYAVSVPPEIADRARAAIDRMISIG